MSTLRFIQIVKILTFLFSYQNQFQKDKNTHPSPKEPNQRNASSGSDGEQNGKKKTRSVTFSILEKESPPSPSVSETSSSRRLSARAARSARRQAKIEVDPIQKDQNGNSSKKVFKRRIDMKHMKRRNGSGSASSNMKKSSEKEEEVVKVKLNTGILYLYKGLNRRAVFVRRI